MLLKNLFESTMSEIIPNKYQNNFRALVKGEAIPLFRGMEEEEVAKFSKVYEEDGISFCEIGTRPSRKSTTGSNFILNYISVAPSWQNVPDRTVSSFCSNEIPGFGDTVYAVIPHDNTRKFAIIDDDFNYAKFPGRFGGILDFVDFRGKLQDLMPGKPFKYDRALAPEGWEAYSDEYNIIELNLNFYLIKKVFIFKDAFTIQEFKGAIECLQKIIDTEKSIPIKFRLELSEDIDDTATQFIQEFLGREHSLIKSFEEFTPDYAGITVVDGKYGFNKIKGAVQGASEIWFEGSYLAIKIDYSKLKKQNLTPFTFFQSEKFKLILKQLQDESNLF